MKKPPKMVPPEKALAFEPMEFFMTFSVANETAFSKNREIDVVRHEAVDPEASRMASFGVAVARRYGNDRVKFDSFMWRWQAWSAYALSGELSREVFPICQDPDRVARCSIEVAAAFPLTKAGRFERQTFLAAVVDRLRMP